MAYFKFTDLIKSGKEIDIYNDGNMYRDFTYIDDIVEALYRLLNVIPKPNHEWDLENSDTEATSAPFHLYNIGNNAPVHLLEFVNILEKALGKKANKMFKPMQQGDVYRTWADCSKLYEKIDFHPSTTLEHGIGKFVEWYESYHPSKDPAITVNREQPIYQAG